MNFQVILHQTT